jgi:hypothetical protein
MNTKISITLRPDEFDLLREAVEEFAKEHELLMNAKDLDPAGRRAAREKAALTRDLLGKLNS